MKTKGATLLTQKTTPITGTKRKQKTAKNTVKFTPHDGGKILMLDYKKRSLVDLRYLVQCHLGKSFSLTQDDCIVMKKRKSTKLQRCKASNVKGKQIFSKPYYRATLNTVSHTDNKKNIKYDVNDKKAICHVDFIYEMFSNKKFFKSIGDAKEYLHINYVLDKMSSKLEQLYQNNYENDEEDNGCNHKTSHIQTLTVKERDDAPNVERKAHYVMSCHVQKKMN